LDAPVDAAAGDHQDVMIASSLIVPKTADAYGARAV
jgi:hypothetical protein